MTEEEFEKKLNEIDKEYDEARRDIRSSCLMALDALERPTRYEYHSIARLRAARLRGIALATMDDFVKNAFEALHEEKLQKRNDLENEKIRSRQKPEESKKSTEPDIPF